jgi:2-polyprenyl-3-methyl-5-hydroxy-6-metoxy-1,4-benzoquinol methylase
MRIISHNKIDFALLKSCLEKPQIFDKSTHKFWDDDYVSGQMLKPHLDPDIEAASRTRHAIESEADFIISSTAMRKGKAVLDLGCGPGLYVREFAKTGAMVTGIDLSGRSIQYAQNHVRPEFANASFHRMNYLHMNFEASFDIATLIFYDFCALGTTEQNILLAKCTPR